MTEKMRLWEPHIHAFVAHCDFGSEGIKQGMLSGVTVGVKDNIDVAGLPTRNGSDACRDTPPVAMDAPVVAALRTTGARIVGKTTTTEFAFTDPTACRNPHDLNRSPGGSSSGSGAAVAAGLVDIALGTQTAGSLCRPAAYCGVVGFKPSYGVLSTEGVTPLATSFDTVGIIAGSVTLAQRGFEAMAPAAFEATQADAKTAQCELWNTSISPNPDILDAFRDASRALSGMGFANTSSPLNAEVHEIVAAHRTVMNFEAAAAHGSMLSDARVERLKPKFRTALRAGALISATDAADAASFLQEAKQAFWQRHSGIDVILTMAVPDAAPLIDGTTGYQDWLTPWTVFGGPLVCLPWGSDALGRPLSVMLAAHPHQDAELLRTAKRLEEISPPLRKPQLP